MLRRIGFCIIPVIALGLLQCGKGSSADLSTDENLQDSINAFTLLADSASLERIKSQLGINISVVAPVSVVTPLSSSIGIDLSSSAGIPLSSGVVLPFSSGTIILSSSSTVILTPSSSGGGIVPLSSSSIGIILPPSSSIKPLSSSVVVLTPSSSNKPLSSSVVVLTPSSSSKPPVSSSVVVILPSSSSKPPSSSSAGIPSSSAATPTACTCDEGCASPLTAGEEGYVGGAVSRCFFRTTGYARTNACDVFEVNGVAQTANVESYSATGPAINGGWYVFIKAAAGCWFGVK